MRFAALAVTVALLAGPAVAQKKVEQFVTGNWRGQAYFDGSGVFTSCSMYAKYRSGISLYFGLTRKGRFRIGFWKADWALAEGSRHAVAIYVDRRRIFRGTATVVSFRNASMVRVDLPLSAALINRFRGGYVLHVDGSRGRIGFSLSGSSAALYKLITCVTSHIKNAVRMKPRPPATSDNPFGGPTARAPSQTPDTAPSPESDRVRAVTLIANVLARAAVAGYRIVPVDDVPKRWRRFHAVWRSGRTLGLVRLYRNVSKSKGRAIYSATAGDDYDQCKGAYQSGVKRGDAEGRTITFFSRCTGAKDWSIFYVIVGPDKAGITYLVGLLSPDKNEPLDLGVRVRRALTEIVLKQPAGKDKKPETFQQ